MTNLVVCGDSFQSPSLAFPLTHWSQLLADELSLPLYNFAIPGASSRHIALQVLHAMSAVDDPLIVFSHASASDRVEMALKPLALTKAITYEHFTKFPGPMHDLIDENVCAASINLYTALNDPDTSTPVKQYLTTHYPAGFNYHLDKWAIFYVLMQLKFTNTKFLFLPSVLDYNLFETQELDDIVGYRKFLSKDQFSFKDFYVDRSQVDIFDDPGYHTTPNSQCDIAELIKNKLVFEGHL